VRKNLVLVALWKVLVPYDGSKESEGGFRKAIELVMLISQDGANVEVNMLYIVGGLVVDSFTSINLPTVLLLPQFHYGIRVWNRSSKRG